MRLWVLCLLFSILCSSGQAEQIVLQSGEHAGFSRIVLQLNPPRDWQLGRVPDGYELRISGPPAIFDISRVFAKIPRQRIKNILVHDNHRITFKVHCACFADAFEIRKGRVVIDIKDGEPSPDSPFEKKLPPKPEHPVWIPASLPDNSSGNLPASASVTFPTGFITRGFPDMKPRHAPPTNLPEQRRAVSRNTASHNSETSDHEQTFSLQHGNGVRSNNLSSPQGTGTRTVIPDLLDLPLVQARRLHEETSKTRNALLLQLARAASQGLADVTTNKTRPILSPGTSEKPAPPNEPMQNGKTIGPDPAATSLGAHMETRSAADTARHDDSAETAEPSTACLSNDRFDIPGWGPISGDKNTFDGLRAKLVGEFDTPDPDAIEQLIRRYLYFGFGAEAHTLLDAFAVPVTDAKLMKELANIMDGETGHAYPIIASQIGCPGNAGLWALIATPTPATRIDGNSIMLAFSQLPAHLQAQFGPTLANRFIDMGNPEAATAIESILKRKQTPDMAALALLKAQLQHLDGNTAEAADALEKIASSAGPHEAEALIALLSNLLEGKKDIPRKLALLADAIAVEYRGTETGRKLAELAIRAFMSAGNSSLAFQRIAQARKTNELSQNILDDLYLEAHIANARYATAPEFLRAMFAYPITGKAAGPQTALARRAIAMRLNKLGLPSQTQQLFAKTHEIPLSPEDRVFLARADLKNGEPEKAIAVLKDQDTPEASRLRAAAYEKLGQLAKAEEIYRQLAQEPDLVRVAWLAGDWKTVQAHSKAPFSDVAKIAFQASKSTGNAARDQVEPGPASPSLSSARTLIEESRHTREVLSRLLAAK